MSIMSSETKSRLKMLLMQKVASENETEADSSGPSTSKSRRTVLMQKKMAPELETEYDGSGPSTCEVPSNTEITLLQSGIHNDRPPGQDVHMTLVSCGDDTVSLDIGENISSSGISFELQRQGTTSKPYVLFDDLSADQNDIQQIELDKLVSNDVSGTQSESQNLILSLNLQRNTFDNPLTNDIFSYEVAEKNKSVAQIYAPGRDDGSTVAEIQTGALQSKLEKSVGEVMESGNLDNVVLTGGTEAEGTSSDGIQIDVPSLKSFKVLNLPETQQPVALMHADKFCFAPRPDAKASASEAEELATVSISMEAKENLTSNESTNWAKAVESASSIKENRHVIKESTVEEDSGPSKSSNASLINEKELVEEIANDVEIVSIQNIPGSDAKNVEKKVDASESHSKEEHFVGVVKDEDKIVKRSKKPTKISGSEEQDPSAPRQLKSRKSLKHANRRFPKKRFKCAECGITYRLKKSFVRHMELHLSKDSHKCGQCTKVYENEEDLNIHKQTHVEEEHLICFECGTVLNSKVSLRLHKKIHARDYKQKCSVCSQGFLSEESLAEHLKMHAKVGKHKCLQCDNSFARKKDLLQHSRLKHKGDKEFTCRQCKQTYTSKRELMAHTKLHALKKSWKCKECKVNIVGRANYVKHMRNHVKSRECKICGARFTKKLHLIKHKRLHNEPVTYKCSDCGTGFLLRKSLDSHMKEHKAMRKCVKGVCYECQVCWGKFSTMEFLVEHIKIHNAEKMNACTECGKEFIFRQTLVKHMRVHNTMKKDLRCRACGIKFTERKNLLTHQLVHVYRKPFECVNCMAVFEYSADLEDHKSKHIPREKQPKKYHCKQCKKSFALESKFIQHMRSRIKRKLIMCSICMTQMTSELSLELHINAFHKFDSLFECDQCSKRFSMKKNLKEHVKLHCRGSEPYTCEKCDTSFAMKSTYIQHKALLCCQSFQVGGADTSQEKTLEAVFSDLCVNMWVDQGSIEFRCPHCLEKFPVRNALFVHVKQHMMTTEIVPPEKLLEKPKELKCDECSKIFKSTEGLRLHKRIHGEREKHECKECGKVLLSKRTLVSHSRIHTGEKLYHCKICGKEFTHYTSLSKHTKAVHEKLRPFKCQKCNKCFSSRGILQRHDVTHTGERKFKCEECGWAFNQNAHLQRHMQGHENLRNGTKPKKYDVAENGTPCKCVECGREFKSFRSLAKHAKMHTSMEKPFKCTEEGCDKAYYTKASFLDHQRVHQKDPDLQCNVCGKYIATKNNLKLHMRIHNDDRPYKCEHCPKTFTVRCNMENHLRLHTGDKPFKCNDCDRTFAQSTTLSKHQKIHWNERPYRCTYCVKSFIQKVHLENHIRTHTGEKPFVCPECNRGFAQKTDMKKHVKIHEREKKKTELVNFTMVENACFEALSSQELQS